MILISLKMGPSHSMKGWTLLPGRQAWGKGPLGISDLDRKATSFLHTRCKVYISRAQGGEWGDVSHSQFPGFPLGPGESLLHQCGQH